jgi:hypothetical protein
LIVFSEDIASPGESGTGFTSQNPQVALGVGLGVAGVVVLVAVGIGVVMRTPSLRAKVFPFLNRSGNRLSEQPIMAVAHAGESSGESSGQAGEEVSKWTPATTTSHSIDSRVLKQSV